MQRFLLIICLSTALSCSGTPEQSIADAGLDISTPDLDADTSSDSEPGDIEISFDADTHNSDPSDISDGSDTGPLLPYTEGDPAEGIGPISIGTGRLAMEPLLQGDTIRWEMGIQGGHHIWVAFEIDEATIDELDEDTRRNVQHHYRITHEDGTLLAQTTRIGGLQYLDTWTGISQYAVLEAPMRPSRMDGDLLHYRVEVDIEGHPTFYRELWLISECCD